MMAILGLQIGLVLVTLLDVSWASHRNVCNRNDVTSFLKELKKYSNAMNCLFEKSVNNNRNGNNQKSFIVIVCGGIISMMAILGLQIGLVLVTLLGVSWASYKNACNRNDVTSFLKELKKYSNAMNCLFEKSVNNNRNGKGGAVYTRWGRTTCPGSGTERMYEGYVGGSWYNSGSAANDLCLPKFPSWGKYRDGFQTWTEKVYGTEYVITYNFGSIQRKYFEHDVPCAVCYSTVRSAVYMIPGRVQCYKGWHMEYTGYLMAQASRWKPSEYICVDKHPEKVHGGQANKNGNLLYPVEAACGSLKCPPYVDGRELACVVCSK